MREVEPPDASLPDLTRSVVACLAAILELEVDEVPAPPSEHPEPWTVWRGWLAQRGLGLVPIDDPLGFNWPGPWLALLASGAVAVAFGSPPGLAWQPLTSSETFADVVGGYVVAPADPVLWAPVTRPDARMHGVVEAIAIAPAAEAPVELVATAEVRAGHGLAGDRYFTGRGTFSNVHARGHDLTLIEAEALEDLALTPAEARRNVVTRGIALDALVGRSFSVGGVECVGQRLCEPCAHLERLAPGTLRPLVHRGGLRADVVGDGVIRVGDPVQPLS